ncbi:MAG: hypothetical protein WCI73_12415 [Phycisphaerae bacterium]
MQLRMMMPTLYATWPHVSAEVATELADLLEAQQTDQNWQIHLHFWGDEKGVVLTKFVEFLRGGGFSVAQHF